MAEAVGGTKIGGSLVRKYKVLLGNGFSLHYSEWLPQTDKWTCDCGWSGDVEDLAVIQEPEKGRVRMCPKCFYQGNLKFGTKGAIGRHP